MALEKLYTVREAADALRLSPWTMYGKLSRGEVMRTRVGGRVMIRESELQKLLVDGGKSPWGRNRMKVDGFRCDGCGVEKRGTNHWFIFTDGGPTLWFATWDAGEAGNSDPRFKHLCGQSCAQKILEQWMNGRQ